MLFLFSFSGGVGLLASTTGNDKNAADPGMDRSRAGIPAGMLFLFSFSGGVGLLASTTG